MNGAPVVVPETDPAENEAAVVRPAARLRGEPGLPGDKSISHRALLLAALAAGDSRIDERGRWRRRPDHGAVDRTAGGLGRAAGRRRAAASRTASYRPVSTGSRRPTGVLDCGNSGTTLRLAAGILAGLDATHVLDGDSSLRRRPVARIIEPLRSMGAVLHARRNDSLPPLTVVGRTRLRAIDHSTIVPSAQVKSAVLLAGLRGDGRTTVREAVATRDHTERMLRARGVPVDHEAIEGGAGAAWSVEGGVRVGVVAERVPADVSAAAFWLVAGAIHPDAELTLRGVGVNPTRRAILELLARMGARIDEIALGGRDDGVGEPLADLTVRSSALEAIDVSPAEVATAIDEIPVLCLAASQARGRTTIRGAGELRHKESDRIAGIAAGLTALGARVSVDGDDLAIDGPTPLVGAETASLDDHRLAMTFAIAGLIARGRTTIDAPGSASISYPGFFSELEGVRA